MNSISTPSTPISNSLIISSSLSNHYLLPVYLYSTNNNHPTHHISTNLSLISDTFAPNASYSLQHPLHIKNTLKELNSLSLISYRDHIDNVSKTTRLCYSLTKPHYEKYFTQIPNSFYETITNYIYEQSQSQDPQPINYFDLITLYCYIKMKIDSFNYAYKATYNSNLIMKEPVSTIATNLNLGTRTITKYLKILVSLNLIKVNSNNTFNRNGINIYQI